VKGWYNLDSFIINHIAEPLVVITEIYKGIQTSNCEIKTVVVVGFLIYELLNVVDTEALALIRGRLVRDGIAKRVVEKLEALNVLVFVNFYFRCGSIYFVEVALIDQEKEFLFVCAHC
jgi:hypothetical protein